VNVTIGTFNLNNLFSRYNFKGEIAAIHAEDTSVESELTYEFGPQDTFKIRSYQGWLVKAKDPAKTQLIAQCIKAMDVDVLAVQEVEDIDTLRQFNVRSHLAQPSIGGQAVRCLDRSPGQTPR
jgi:hypothetical protein